MSKSNAMLAPQVVADVSLTRDDMSFIAKLVYEQAGIVIREHKEAMTRGRLARRVKALGLSSVTEYCAYLKTPQAADEIPELINAVTTNHTSFFRERHHFDHLRKDVLPKLLQERSARRGRIRIWCSASSSGEEPYSIAAVSRDVLGSRSDVDFKILATDIDTDILMKAEAGDLSDGPVRASALGHQAADQARTAWAWRGHASPTICAG